MFPAVLFGVLVTIVGCLAECDIAGLALVAKDLKFDAKALKTCQYLVGKLVGCDEEEAQELRNRLLYKSGLIELSLGQEMAAIESFEAIPTALGSGISSLAHQRLHELYQNYGMWDKLPRDDNRKKFEYLKGASLRDLSSGKLPPLADVEQMIEMSPWQREARILENDIFYDRLAESNDINSAQSIISNYEVILNKHRKSLSINDKLKIHYAITVLQLFVISTPPSHLKKCLNLDMDYLPCRQLSKIASSINKVNPPHSAILHADGYFSSTNIDWNRVLEFYLNSPPFIETEEFFENNLDLINHLAGQHVMNILNDRPLSALKTILVKAPPITDFNIKVNLILCEALDILSTPESSKQFCDLAMLEVLPKDERKSLIDFPRNLRDKDLVKDVLEKLWRDLPHLAAHAVNYISSSLSTRAKRVKEDGDTAVAWQLIESFVNEHNWNKSPNKYLDAIATNITKFTHKKRQERQQKYFQQQGQQSRWQKQQHYKNQMAPKASANKDYYKILGVSRQADTKEIRKAYLSLTKKYHPDKQGQLSEAQQLRNQEKMSEINEAYETLSDESKRKEYNDQRRSPGPNNRQQFQHQNPFDFSNGFKVNFGFQRQRRPAGH